MSGENPTIDYNEPGAMRSLCLIAGRPRRGHRAGLRRAAHLRHLLPGAHIFGVREAILVTQGFHLPRALYLCNKLGIAGVGVPADLRHYRRSSRAVLEPARDPCHPGCPVGSARRPPAADPGGA